jgi:hypothetical protein
MSNTYFERNEDYSLTAFIGGGYILQLTVGISYANLSKDDCIALAGALLERAHGAVSATGNEVSIFNKEQL